MKKIVALVLALVMVMGLATVATAATFEDGKQYYIVDMGTFTYEEGQAASLADGDGWIEYFTDGTTNMVVCAAGDKGAKAVKAGSAEGDAVLGYAKVYAGELLYNYAGTAVAKSDLSCTTDQYAAGFTADKDYDGKIEADEYFTADASGTTKLLVAGKVVKVAPQTPVAGSHVLYLYKTAKVSDGVFAYKCGVCGDVFNCTTNKALAGANPAKYDVADATTAKAVFFAEGYEALDDTDKTWAVTDMFIIGAGSVSDTATDKVESAETFDAGIAMYVGMSVMAAAGSAVVLKKKD